jgi:hypothetical protein
MRNSWCYWSAVDCDVRATCSWSRLKALVLGRLLGVLLFTAARSMGRAVQWSPMKPDSWSGWFPIKSWPTCSCRWLHCDLQNVPRDHAKCTAGNVRANRSKASCWLTALHWTDFFFIFFVTFRLTVSQSIRLGVKPILGLLTRNLSLSGIFIENWGPVSFGAPSLTRGRVCRLLV